MINSRSSAVVADAELSIIKVAQLERVQFHELSNSIESLQQGVPSAAASSVATTLGRRTWGGGATTVFFSWVFPIGCFYLILRLSLDRQFSTSITSVVDWLSTSLPQQLDTAALSKARKSNLLFWMLVNVYISETNISMTTLRGKYSMTSSLYTIIDDVITGYENWRRHYGIKYSKTSSRDKIMIIYRWRRYVSGDIKQIPIRGCWHISNIMFDHRWGGGDSECIAEIERCSRNYTWTHRWCRELDFNNIRRSLLSNDNCRSSALMHADKWHRNATPLKRAGLGRSGIVLEPETGGFPIRIPRRQPAIWIIALESYYTIKVMWPCWPGIHTSWHSNCCLWDNILSNTLHIPSQNEYRCHTISLTTTLVAVGLCHEWINIDSEV